MPARAALHVVRRRLGLRLRRLDATQAGPLDELETLQVGRGEPAAGGERRARWRSCRACSSAVRASSTAAAPMPLQVARGLERRLGLLPAARVERQRGQPGHHHAGADGVTHLQRDPLQAAPAGGR